MSKIDEPNKEFNFIKSLSDFYMKFVSKFKDENLSNINDDIIHLGRTEEEKEQLQEMGSVSFSVSEGLLQTH